MRLIFVDRGLKRLNARVTLRWLGGHRLQRDAKQFALLIGGGDLVPRGRIKAGHHILALMGLVGGSHWLLVLGGTGVVLLNIGRVVAGVANLVVIPFRESPVKGLLFLLPPVTVVYLAQNWPKVRRPPRSTFGS